jgi:hypothetical protein
MKYRYYFLFFIILFIIAFMNITVVVLLITLPPVDMFDRIIALLLFFNSLVISYYSGISLFYKHLKK